jgi:hypothetical protein
MRVQIIYKGVLLQVYGTHEPAEDETDTKERFIIESVCYEENSIDHILEALDIDVDVLESTVLETI